MSQYMSGVKNDRRKKYPCRRINDFSPGLSDVAGSSCMQWIEYDTRDAIPRGDV